MEGDDQARRRVRARGDPRVGAGQRLQDAPAPLDDRIACRIDADAPVEPRGRASRVRFEHYAQVALDEAILGARREGRNDEGVPTAGRRLAGAARGEPRRFDQRAVLTLELGDDRGRGEQLFDRDADAAGERHTANEHCCVAGKFRSTRHLAAFGSLTANPRPVLSHVNAPIPWQGNREPHTGIRLKRPLTARSGPSPAEQ